MIEDGVVGVTSNPTIFEKAISGSNLYDEQLQQVSGELDDPKEVFLELARVDIQEACDLLMPVFERTDRLDGYVSLEVSPDLAYDVPATVDEAMRLHKVVDRPNLMVKIPATQPGLAAVEEMIAAGKSINVTLIFSLARYRAVAGAYIRGLQRLVAAGGDPSGVASVARSSSAMTGSFWSRRARRNSALSGPRPRRRTRTIKTRSTWTTSSAPPP
jgi:transaldolase